MNVVKTGDGRFIEVQGTAEGPAVRAPRARRAARARRRRHPAARVDAARDPSGDIGTAVARLTLVVATTNPGKIREIAGILHGRAGRRCVTLRGLPADRRAGGDRRDVRGERAAQGALLRRRARACPASPTTPASRSTRSTTARRPLGALGRRRLRREVRAHSRAAPRARAGDQRRTLRLPRRARRARRASSSSPRGSSKARSRRSRAGDARLRLRPDLFLPAVRPHARRSAA